MFGKLGNITNLETVIKEARHGFHEEISDQLNDLIKKGLLIVVSEDPTIVHNIQNAEVEIRYNVRIECPAEKKIQELEESHKKQIEDLQSKLTKAATELCEYKKAIALLNGSSHE